MRRARWVLVAAFVLSILIHTLVAMFLHRPRPAIVSERVTMMRRTTVTRLTPSPVRTPRRQPQLAVPHLAASRPRTSSRALGPAPPVATPTVTPARSVGVRCVIADAAAGVVATPPSPQIPPTVRALDVSGTAAILVQLDNAGSVVSASIEQSSGDASFDAIAMGMARGTTYAPARHACTAIASSYLFRVRFFAW